MIVLIDTNILLDHLQQRQPHDAPAAHVWKLVEAGNLEGYVSVISLNNIFYIARKQAGNEKALDVVKLVRRIFRLVPLDEQMVDRAIASSAKTTDFEDAIQGAAAERVNAEYVITRNAADFASMGLMCVTAQELLALLPPP
jgi:predicted nucleic acid-binding protein